MPDVPSAEDYLGFGPLIDGLARLLDDEGTDLPLAIAVNAPWGAGKSSAMLQLQDRLNGETAKRRWWIVEFDAWKYEKSERLWAALAKAIYDDAMKAMPSRWARFTFRLRLERKRLGTGRFAAQVIAPFVLAAAVIAVVLTTGVEAPAKASFTGLAGLLGLVQAGRLAGIAADPFKRAIDRYAGQARYAEQLGFTAEANDDIANLTALLTEKRKLAVFVDDLDRCSPAHVVEVVEAINQIFNADEDRQCLFILGMDRDVVAASIEAAYDPLRASLKERRDGLAHEFGLRFLAKLVQLSVAIPVPSDTDMKRLLGKMTGNPVPAEEAEEGAAPPPPSDDDVRSEKRRLEQAQPRNPAEVEEVAERMTSGEGSTPALQEAVRQVRADLFTTDSEDVAKAEFELLDYLPRNPRDLKRFDNAFRLQLHVANGTPGCDLRFDLDQLVALGKWVALRLRWPDVADRLDADHDLLERLEDHVNDGGAAPDGFEWPADRKDFDALLREKARARRLTGLPARTFLRVL